VLAFKDALKGQRMACFDWGGDVDDLYFFVVKQLLLGAVDSGRLVLILTD
jgi:hypothetical protein